MAASYYDDEKKMAIEEMRALRVLGRGAMGTVFMALREGCDHPFALKVIVKGADGRRQDEGFRKLRAIAREREILSTLRHPFLPSLIGQIETDKIVGWAVEYCPGGDLYRLRQIQPDKVFSESAIRSGFSFGAPSWPRDCLQRPEAGEYPGAEKRAYNANRLRSLYEASASLQAIICRFLTRKRAM